MGNCCISKKVKPKILIIHDVKEITEPENSNCKLEGSMSNKQTSRSETGKRCQDAKREKIRTSVPEHPVALTTRPKTILEITRIKLAICRSNFLRDLPNKTIEELITQMKLLQVKSKDVIYGQDSLGDRYYVLTNGQLKVSANDEEAGFIHPGEGIGELELLHDTPRTCKVTAVTDAHLWVLERERFSSVVKDLEYRNWQEDQEFVETLDLFNDLTYEEKKSLLMSSVVMKFDQGSRIVSEGESGSVLYIIKEGSVTLTVNNSIKRTMNTGDIFCEQVILYDNRVSETATAQTKTTCFTISKKSLKNCLSFNLEHFIYKSCIRIALEHSKILRRLAKYQQQLLVNSFQFLSFAKGSTIIDKGENLCEKLRVIIRGGLNYKGVNYDHYSILGDEYIISAAPCPASEAIIARCDTEIAGLTREAFHNILGAEISNLFLSSKLMNVIQKIPILRGISNKRMARSLSHLRIMEYCDSEEIVTQGTEATEFYIVKKGSVEIYKDNVYMRTIRKYDFFGERSIIKQEIRSATAKAVGDVICWVLNKNDFLNIIEARKTMLNKRLMLQDDTVSLDNLLYIKNLGQGHFGNVYLVTHQDKFTLYALKTVSKRKVEKYQCFDALNLERKILLQLDDYPFIIKLVKTFRDDSRVYFLLEYVRGLDLFTTLRQTSLLSESHAQFYASCLLLIIEHLHERNIVHRDLKPENVMIDENGYPMLIDFGAAKIVPDRTVTIIGTPHYMAPEIILGLGYNKSVDLWSLGVMIYEFVFGRVPFGEKAKGPQEVYSEILSSKTVSYPHAIPKSEELVQLLEKLLNKNPSLREADLKCFDFFKTMDFVRYS
jgi:cGMP-dependent protein kinase